MTQSPIDVGEKVHIIAPRVFKEDMRRHFAGEVMTVSLGLIRIQGYAFAAAVSGLDFTRLPGLRTRVFGIFAFRLHPEYSSARRYHRSIALPFKDWKARFDRRNKVLA